MAGKSRHASMGEQLAALLAYANRPAGIDEDTDVPTEAAPISTNWRIVAANDNNPEDLAGMRTERRWEITPSVEEIERSLSGVEFDGNGRPSGGDVERNEAGQVIRLGKIHFSDGTQTEKAFKLTIDGKAIQHDARLPVGAMTGTKDRATALAGSGNSPSAASNGYFATILDTPAPRHIPGKRARRTGQSYTSAESRKILDDAWENTDPSRVTYTKCPPGLPCASAQVGDSFLGMKKTTGASSGMMAWEDIASAIISREVWVEAMATLTAKDRMILRATVKAKRMAEIGMMDGARGKIAERKGKQEIMAANDNLSSALKKSIA